MSLCVCVCVGGERFYQGQNEWFRELFGTVKIVCFDSFWTFCLNLAGEDTI
jgi:hypothetical protein